MPDRVSLPAIVLGVAIAAAGCARVAHNARHDPQLTQLPAGRWVKIHQQAASKAAAFPRQPHGGSAFDSKRGRLILFGSETHGAATNWTNGIYIFDLAARHWFRPYPDDSIVTYRLDPRGRPVAGKEGARPWAMHTFGAVAYDPARDHVVVASYPGHLLQSEAHNQLDKLWSRIANHPTWMLDAATLTWTARDSGGVHFFPFAIAYDDNRSTVLGYRDDGIYELNADSNQWRRVAENGRLQWGLNTAYDSAERALVVFGSHRKGNEVVAYWPSSGRHRTMPTLRRRPPGGNNVPLAYHRTLGRTVALLEVDSGGHGHTETWLYDLGRDRWERYRGADLPFAVGMNYNLEYDPNDRVLLLVAAPPGEPVAVWALRLPTTKKTIRKRARR